jgi:hypothetical protein
MLEKCGAADHLSRVTLTPDCATKGGHATPPPNP